MTKYPSVCVDAVTRGKPGLQGSSSNVLFFLDNSIWGQMEAQNCIVVFKTIFLDLCSTTFPRHLRSTRNGTVNTPLLRDLNFRSRDMSSKGVQGTATRNFYFYSYKAAPVPQMVKTFLKKEYLGHSNTVSHCCDS